MSELNINQIAENNNQINQNEYFYEDLKNSEWLGEIVDNNDPLKLGRCKIRIFEKFDEIPDDALPWATPIQPQLFAGGEDKGGGYFSYPKIGTLVRIRFNSGDIYHPEYYMIENLNKKMINEIKDSYENSHVILYDEDEDLKIIYTKNKGLLIFHKQSLIQIDKDKHINIQHATNNSMITLIDDVITIKAKSKIHEQSNYIYLDSTKVDVGHNADESITRWESLYQLLNALAAIIDSKIPIAPAAVQLVTGPLSLRCGSKTAKVAP